MIAIIGVLVGMLLPAVQAARESARRSRCQSNVRQIGLAFANCADAKRYYPAAMYSAEAAKTTDFPSPPEGNPARREHSWRVLVMPFMEEQSAIATYNWNKHWYDTTSNSTPARPVDAAIGVPPDCNLAAGTKPVAVYVCPTTPPRNVGSFTVPASPDTGDSARPAISAVRLSVLATSDYETMTAVKLKVLNPDPYTDQTSKGLLDKDRLTRARQITDGLSKTLLVVEAAGKPNTWQAGKLVSTPLAPRIYAQGISWADNLGPFKLDGLRPDGTDRAASNAGVAMNASNEGECYSFHRGGANVVFGDTSTRFIADSIDLATFCGLVTRAGGEAIGTVP